jgi:hypothetical protein
MIALKDLANRLGSGNIWHEGGFPDMSAGEGACWACWACWASRGRGCMPCGAWNRQCAAWPVQQQHVDAFRLHDLALGECTAG